MGLLINSQITKKGSIDFSLDTSSTNYQRTAIRMLVLVGFTGLDNLLWQQRQHPKTTLQLTGEGEGHETTLQLTGEGEGHDYCMWCQKRWSQ